MSSTMSDDGLSCEPMKGLHILIIPMILLFITAGRLHAQHPWHIAYSTAEGLSGNEVYDVIQDKKGYMWFSTNRGVSRFNGYTFQNFSAEDGLGDNSVIGLYEDNEDRIWCRGANGRISFIQHNKVTTIEAHIPVYYANSLFIDDEQVIWVGSQTAGSWFKIAPPYRQENLTAFRDNGHQAVIVQKGNNVVFTRAGGPGKTIVIDVMKNHRQFVDVKNYFPNFRVKSSNDDMLIVSDDEVCILDKNHVLTKSTVNSKPNNIYRDRNNNLWVCLSEAAGVICYENSNLNQSPKGYFSQISISSVFQDEEGAYWFSTLSDGVLYVPSLNWISCFLPSDDMSKAKNLFVADNRIFLSFLTEKINVLNDNDEFTFHDPIKDPVPGLIVLRKKSPFQAFTSGVQNAVRPDPIYAEVITEKDVLPLDENHFLTASYLNVFKVNNATLNIVESYTAPSRINARLVCGSDSLLLACSDGLFSFYNRSFHRLFSDNSSLNGRINDIGKDSTGNIWLATASSGIVVLNNGNIHYLNKKDGLSSNQCESLFFEKEQVLIGSANGLNYFSGNPFGAFSITQKSFGAGFKTTTIYEVVRHKNKLILHTDEGMFRYDGEQQTQTGISPKIHITSFLTNNQSLDFNAPINLKHNDNNILIRFDGISYLMPSSNTYKYILEGIDSDWHITTAGQIQYPSLRHGDYKFLVYAINAAGISSDHPAVIEFSIQKPFWLTWWFIALALISLLSLVFAITFLRLRHINRLALEDQKTKTRMASVEMRVLRAQMNPHFVFNSINSIQHYILDHDKLLASKHLSRFSRLMRNVLENSMSEFVSISKEIDTLKLYIEMESLRFESRFSYNIVLDKSIESVTTSIPPMIIQPLAENAILHGLLPLKDRKGVLEIHLRITNQILYCTIEDNGIGRSRAMEIKQSRTSGHESHGLSILRERLQLFNKSHPSTIPFELKVTDKYDIDKMACGTKVEITLPVQYLTQ